MPGNYVGKVEGTDALISVVVGKNYVVAYVCDFDQIAQGFGGGVNGKALTLAALEGQGLTKVNLAGSMATGTVTIAGVERAFTARTAPTTAGYFFADGMIGGTPVQARWVVEASGEQRGAVIDRTSTFISVTVATLERKLGQVEGRIGDVKRRVIQVLPTRPGGRTDTAIAVDSLRTGY